VRAEWSFGEGLGVWNEVPPLLPLFTVDNAPVSAVTSFELQLGIEPRAAVDSELPSGVMGASQRDRS
jgi:hypothetical protein